MEKRRILIIDDDPAMAELLAEFCQEMGHETRVVTDSRRALPAAVEFRPHLITLDLEMPYLDGMELDFAREGLNEGFKFNNPNVKDQCGCGESFNV